MSANDTSRKLVLTQVKDLESQVAIFKAMKKHTDPINEFGTCSEILFDLKWIIADYNRIRKSNLGVFSEEELVAIENVIFDATKIVKNYLATVKTSNDITED